MSFDVAAEAYGLFMGRYSDPLAVRFATAEDWWHPYTLGVGPAGAYVASLDPTHRDALRQHCETLLPPLPVTVTASAWTAHART